MRTGLLPGLLFGPPSGLIQPKTSEKQNSSAKPQKDAKNKSEGRKVEKAEWRKLSGEN